MKYAIALLLAGCSQAPQKPLPDFALDLDLQLRAQHAILDKMIAHSLDNMRKIDEQIEKARGLRDHAERMMK